MPTEQDQVSQPQFEEFTDEASESTPEAQTSGASAQSVVEPTAAETQPPAAAATPPAQIIPQELVLEAARLAADLGVPADVIDSATPEQLIGFALRQRNAPAQQAQPAQAQKQDDEFKIDIGVNEATGEPNRLHPGMETFLKAQADEIKQLKKRDQERDQAEKARRVEEQNGIIEDAFDALPPEIKKLTGEGTRFDLKQGSKEMKRRLAIISAAGISPEDSPRIQKRKIMAAAVDVLGDTVAPTPPADKKPSKRPTLEDYEQGGVVNPTSRPVTRTFDDKDEAVKKEASALWEKYGFPKSRPETTLDNVPDEPITKATK